MLLRRELKQLVRRQPTATLLDVRGEVIRWECEGLPGGGRGPSHLVPSPFGLQCGVQGSRGATTPPRVSEQVELKEMMRLQQEQLNQLTQSISAELSFTSPSTPSWPFCLPSLPTASECDGVRVPFCTQPSLSAHQPPNRQSHQQSAQESEN